MNRKRHFVGVVLSSLGVLSLALEYTSTVIAQETIWATDHDAGQQAYSAGRYDEAERLFRLAVTEAERFGPFDQRLAENLNDLAMALFSQGKYDAAEPLYIRSLAIREKALGRNHPDVAVTLRHSNKTCGYDSSR